jgi:amidase
MRLLPLLTAGTVLATMAALAPTADAGVRPTGSPAADCRAHVAGLDLQTASFADLERAMAQGRLTSRQLTQAYLDRIEAYDGPINSIRELNKHALAEADHLDAERRSGHVRGPLHGLPILLKDNIGTSDQPTTAGSIALEGSTPRSDAFLTARLRAAGAVVLGKTNLSEFANWVDLSMPNGYSSLGGQVKNAYNMGDPSGSSSGSGVASSMAFSAGSFGSETSGSILSPSDVNGLVGVKPTRGLVSRAGIIPLAEGFDTAGPMTRSVADAAALLTAVAGPDPRDPATAESAHHVTDYVKALHGASLTGVRLGYSANAFSGGSDAQNKVFADVLADLKRLGATLVDTDVVEDGGTAGAAELALIPNDFKANLNHYLTTEIPTPRSGVKSLSDIVAFNSKHPDKVKYGQGLLQASEATPGDATSASASSLGLRTTMGELIDGALAKDGLDAILATGASYASAGASAGYPTVIVPAGLVGSTPTGVSFLGTAWSEAKLLRIAAAYEAGSHRRVPPTVLNGELIRGC